MIRVNRRDEIEWEQDLTVSVLLERFRYTFAHIIVTIDGEVVQPDEYDTRSIPDGSDVQVIHLIAGG
jgi:thiamine biosynthesis protein ThiS